MKARVRIEVEAGAYIVRLPANLCADAGWFSGQSLTVEPVAGGLLLQAMPRLTLEQRLAAFDPAVHGGEAMPDNRVGLERIRDDQR